MNEFRNMLFAEDLPTEVVDEFLLKIIVKREKYGCYHCVKQKVYQLSLSWRLQPR